MVFLSCQNNNIRTFDGFPRDLGGGFQCTGNPVYHLWKLFNYRHPGKENVELFNYFGITDGEVIILDRLNEFLEMIGSPTISHLYDHLYPLLYTAISSLKMKGYKVI